MEKDELLNKELDELRSTAEEDIDDEYDDDEDEEYKELEDNANAWYKATIESLIIINELVDDEVFISHVNQIINSADHFTVSAMLGILIELKKRQTKEEFRETLKHSYDEID